MRLAVGPVDIAAGEAHGRIAPRDSRSAGGSPRVGEGVGVQDVDVVRRAAAAEAGADTDIVAGAVAAVAARLEHPTRPPVPAGGADARREICRRSSRPAESLSTMVISPAMPSISRSAASTASQRHLGRPVVQDDGQELRLAHLCYSAAVAKGALEGPAERRAASRPRCSLSSAPRARGHWAPAPWNRGRPAPRRPAIAGAHRVQSLSS